MYNVFLGNLELYCVEDFEETSKRQIAVHSTLGAGEVPIYNDKELRSWKLTCELSNYRQPMHHVFTPASDIFAVFEGWLAAGEEQRLVVVSDSITLSEMVMLKSYRKNETTQGVFDVTIELTEYKEVSVRTADIPFIQRPGKIPPLPPVKPGNPAKLTSAEDTDAAYLALGPLREWEAKNPQKPIVSNSDLIAQSAGKLRATPLSSFWERVGAELDYLTAYSDERTLQAIGKAYDDFSKKAGKELGDWFSSFK